MEILAKFDDNGQRTATVIKTINYTTEEEKQNLLKDGFVEITESDWLYYIGNEGKGDNGTGYVRDKITGKPVSAPPFVKSRVEKLNELRSEYLAEIRNLKDALLIATLSNNTELIHELQEGYAEIMAEYKNVMNEVN